MELGPNPLNDTDRTYKMFQSGDLPLYMSIAQENLDYDIVVGGKGNDVIAVENWNAGIYAKVDTESTKAKQDYLGKTIKELQFRLTLATDQASKDSINAQITQLNAEYLLPVYLGYVLSGEKAGFSKKVHEIEAKRVKRNSVNTGLSGQV